MWLHSVGTFDGEPCIQEPHLQDVHAGLPAGLCVQPPLHPLQQVFLGQDGVLPEKVSRLH